MGVSSNFDFLAAMDERFARIGALGERFFLDDAPCPFRKLEPSVLMVKSTEHFGCDDTPSALNWSTVGGIFLQTEMRARRVITGCVGLQNAPKVRFATHDYMVETFAPDRSNHAFDIAVLPG